MALDSPLACRRFDFTLARRLRMGMIYRAPLPFVALLSLVLTAIFRGCAAFSPCFRSGDFGAVQRQCQFNQLSTSYRPQQQHVISATAGNGDPMEQLAAAWMNMNRDPSDADPSPPAQPLNGNSPSGSNIPSPAPAPAVPSSQMTNAANIPAPDNAASDNNVKKVTATRGQQSTPRQMTRHSLVRNVSTPWDRDGASPAATAPKRSSVIRRQTTIEGPLAAVGPQISTRWDSVPKRRNYALKGGQARNSATDTGTRRMPLNEVRAPIPTRTITTVTDGRTPISPDSVRALPKQIATRWASVPKLKAQPSVANVKRTFASDTGTRKMAINEVKQIATRWDSVPRVPQRRAMPQRRSSSNDIGTRRMAINEISRTPAFPVTTIRPVQRKAISAGSGQAEVDIPEKEINGEDTEVYQEQQPTDTTEELDEPPEIMEELDELAPPEVQEEEEVEIPSPPEQPEASAPAAVTMEQLAREWGAINQDHDV